MSYESLIASKMKSFQPTGIKVPPEILSRGLFPVQVAIVRWMLRMGRAACFADTGLGKTRIQLEFARQVVSHTCGSVLIYCPLAVASQTIDEGAEMGISVTQVRYPEQMVGPGIYITNYDRFHLFEGAELAGLILDESAVLRDYTSKTKESLIAQAQNVPFRGAFTATPAPNDITEIANHAEFLGIKSRVEMLATYFINSGESGGEKWRLKGHAVKDFYAWLASWAVYLRKPSDLGFSDEGYDLPPLHIREVIVPCDNPPEGMLFATGLSDGIAGRSAVRRSTLEARIEAVAQLVEAEPEESWILWTGLNSESDALERRLRDSTSIVRVEGRDSEEEKVERLRAFRFGEAKVLISKSRVSGAGLNLQICARQAFVGLSDSFSDFYQSIRRSWRFGQTRPVNVHIVVSEAETAIVENVRNKEQEAKIMGDSIIANIGDLNKAALEEELAPVIPPGHIDTRHGDGWTLYHGDCVDVMRDVMQPESVDMAVFSPPFATLYTYSDNPRDMGNSSNHDEFWGQFEYFVEQLYRVMRPGRIAAVHVAQIASTIVSDGVSGLKDFRGKTIEAFCAGGWVYHGDIPISKNPQAQAIRTHSHALLFKSFEKDRTINRPALSDFILVFKKPGENPVPVRGGLDRETWIKWAASVWTDIRESRTLNAGEFRDQDDERHICPLQLDAIERCIQLWTNPGEIVFSPFSGIGSEGFGALTCERRFIGVELKPSYFRGACTNLRRAEQMRGQQSLFA